jgi:ParB family chromosome partitioning protein
MSVDKKRALGRGLSALIPGAAATTASLGTPGSAAAATLKRDYFECAIEDVHPSADNPRKAFQADKLRELAESIKTQGLVQPLVVRARPETQGGGFVLIAGERRWRAAQLAGLKTVPVVVKDVSEAEAFERALVENLQREDLNPIEEAEAYQRLLDEHGYTQEELATRVGKDRATVANTLRLLKLPPSVRTRVADGSLPMGHARALLGLLVADERPEGKAAAIERLASEVIRKQLSTRQTEALVKREKSGASAKDKKGKAQESASVRDLTQRLERALGTKVRIVQKSNQAGTIEIDYASLDQLDGLLEKLLGSSG